jgi:CubicO group peptidase (beta-lactamase class C family)
VTTTTALRAAATVAALALGTAAACASGSGRAEDTAIPEGALASADAPGDDVAPAAQRAAIADTVRRVLDAAVADRAFPGAFAIVGNARGVIAHHGAGTLDWPGPAGAVPAVPDAQTMWDLASLTKVVGLTSALVQLVADGKVALDAPVQRYLPDWRGAGKERVTVRQLLTHASGLPAWRPLHKEAASPEAALALAFATELDILPGARYVYSDLGLILLAKVVERTSGEPLDQYLARHVFGPLGMRDTRYRPDASQRARIAPTEYDPWRQRKLRGEVHDENAFALGGVAGHAGLFSTGDDLARFARAYLGGGALDGVRVFDAALVRQFTTRQDSALSHRALGWETPTGQNSAGHLMAPTAFGHTGFTGTSLWIDPAHDVFVILLTNRVNPTRQNPKIGAVRVALADAVLAVVRGPAPPSSSSRR